RQLSNYTHYIPQAERRDGDTGIVEGSGAAPDRHAGAGLQPAHHTGPARVAHGLSRAAGGSRVLSRGLQSGVRRSGRAVQRDARRVRGDERADPRHLGGWRVVSSRLREEPQSALSAAIRFRAEGRRLEEVRRLSRRHRRVRARAFRDRCGGNNPVESSFPRWHQPRSGWNSESPRRAHARAARSGAGGPGVVSRESAAGTLTPQVSDSDHAEGPSSAPVTLVEYGDYECPSCGGAFPIVKTLQQKMGKEMR